MRANEQAILVGAKTIINDNPQLNVRQVTGKSPHRFIVDPYCDIPESKVVFNDEQPTTVFVVKNHYKKMPSHVEIIEISSYKTSAIIREIYKKNMLSVFIEGGAYTINQFIQADLWDEAIVITGNLSFKNGVLAPKLDLMPHDIQWLGNDQFQYFKNS